MATPILSNNRFRLILLGSLTVWVALQVLALYDLNVPVRIAVVDSVVSNVLLAIICVSLSNSLRYYLPQKQGYWYIPILSTGFTAIWVAVSRIILIKLPLHSADYISLLSASLPIRFGVGFLIIGGTAVISVLWYSVEDQKEFEKRKVDAEKLAREAELFKLRQQLQPHFLFNSLNSISALIGTRPEEARNMIQQLSDFLRGTLKKEESKWVPLSEELNYLQLYLDIEKVRFGHRLATVVECDESSGEMKLPPLLLQPIVENAIKFGLYDTTEAITIRITAKVVDSQLLITVQNPFDPETANPRKGTGFGLSSVQRRLQLLFNRNDLLETHATENLFTTTITIPQQHD